MASDRRQVRLGNALTTLLDHRGRTPKKLGGEFTTSGVPVISAMNVKDGRLVLDAEPRFVSREMHARWMPETLRIGDVILTSEAPLGEMAYLRDDAIYCLGQRLFALRADPAQLDSRFLYYCLRSTPMQQQLHARATGTTAQGIRQSELVKVILDLPPLPEQRAIARILGALDDKIELNRRMNATLEALARALFTSWFVDFDPVRAKAEGRQPAGMDAATAALFPDAFEESEIGPIPQGWPVANLPELFSINPPRSLRAGEVAPYLDMGNMPTASARAVDCDARAYGSGMRFVNGDVLVARITPCLENGKTAFVDFLPEGQVGWGSTEYIVLRSKPPLPLEYAYFLARSDDFRSHTIANMTGTSGRQRVPVDCLSTYRVVAPPRTIAEQFGQVANETLAVMKSHDEQSRTLAGIRDALLPKLLSGEARVREAETALLSQR